MKRIAMMACALLLGAASPEQVATLKTLVEADLRVATIGYRLATANVALCERRVPTIGLVLHGAEQYEGAYRAAAVEMFGFRERPVVAGVVEDSPAARAKVSKGDEIVSIAPATPVAGGGDAVERLLDELDAALRAGPVTLRLLKPRHHESPTLTGVPACASRFQVRVARDMNAAADGKTVQITTGFMAQTANDDELAALLAHELAHNILEHPAKLDAAGVSRGLLGKIGADARRVRETEIAADRLSITLLAKAGYRTEAAAQFWRRFGKEHDDGILSAQTHLRWKKRVALLEAEIAAQRDR